MTVMQEMAEETNNEADNSSQKRIVCVRCARIKQACSGGTPCLRCMRLDVPCEPNIRTGRGRNAANAPPLSTAKITRTHTGCTACRRRKKKCDEQRPKCFDCRRLCLDCNYNEPKKRKISQIVTPGVRSRSPEESEFRAVTEDVDKNIDSAVDFDLGFLDHMEDLDCWDDSMGIWSTSSQSGLSASTPDTLSLQHGSPRLSMVALSTTPDMLVDEDRSLLNHYVNVVARVLSRRDDNRSNPYLANIMPLAFSSPVVMNAVLTLSAKHWKKVHPALWNRGIIHQTKAIQTLSKLLGANDNSSTDEVLCATLLLCMIELFDGTSSYWQFHLDGARRILSSMKQNQGWQTNTDLRAFYRKLYHYLDSATTISTCCPPLLDSSDGSNASSVNKADSPAVFDDDEAALYGIPRSLFHFLDRINSLAYQRKFRADTIFENVFLASAAKIAKDLEDWVDAYRLHERSADISISVQEHAALQATTAYEQALELRLHQVVNGYSQHHEKVQQCVNNILEAIQSIRYGSPLESSLIFPLVLAGSSCETENQRSVIRDRLLVMERTFGFQCIYTAHELVKRVWQERDEATEDSPDVNWAAIRYYQIPGLAFV